MTQPVTALQSMFAAIAVAFALQRLIESVEPAVPASWSRENKKFVIGLFTLALAATLVQLTNGLLLVLAAMGASPVMPLIDVSVSALIISGGAEAFNSILKLLEHKKDQTGHATAANENARASADDRDRDTAPSDPGAELEEALSRFMKSSRPYSVNERRRS